MFLRSITRFGIILGILLSAGCTSIRQETGLLTGHVEIGPLTPVSRVGVPDPTPSPAMYAAWKIVILSQDGKKELARVDIGPTGDYQVRLSVGTYLVTAKPVNGAGIGGAQVQAVNIGQGQVTRKDISIDTGIR